MILSRETTTQWRAAFTKCAVAGVLFSLAPAVAGASGMASASAKASPARVSFSLAATEGYSVSVQGVGHKVALSVESGTSGATYAVDGLVSSRRLKARIGNLGRIAVRFVPSGESRRTGPPKGCKGRPTIKTRGVFVGKISFRGEDGYTQVRARRAQGNTTIRRPWRCESPQRGPEPEFDFDEVPLGLPVLAAFTPGSRAVFGVVGSNKSEEELTLFVGAVVERRGSMRVGRYTLAEGKKGSFDFAGDLDTASVDPPKPFRGSADFARDAAGATSWLGTLSVDLPGRDDIALTGPKFTADLSRPKTLGELVALFGLPGLFE